jgi:hypothetical protein
MIYRGIFPKCAALVDNGYTALLAYLEGREPAQSRGMGVQYIRPNLFHQGVHSPCQPQDHLKLARYRQIAREISPPGCSVKQKTVHFFRIRPGQRMLAPRDLPRFPPQGTLMQQNVTRSKRVASLDGNGMIQYVEYAHNSGRLPWLPFSKNRSFS